MELKAVNGITRSILGSPNMIARVTTKVEQLGDEFHSSKGMILTEDDLKCYLFNKLYSIPYLRKLTPTADPEIIAGRIHAEVSWFNDDELLGDRPDITILEPSDMSILHAVQKDFRLPSKGFHALGNSIVFELKFFREAYGIRQAEVQLVRTDVEKVQRLYDKMRRSGYNHFLFGFIVVFAKYSSVCPEFAGLLQEVQSMSNIKLIYRTAGVTADRPNIT